MSLTEDLAKAREASNARIPEENRKVLQGAIKDLKNSGIVDLALRKGDPAPDIELPNAVGATVDVAAMLERGPVVVTFYRGGWCPYCNLELKALQARLPEIHDLGAELVAISPETPDNALTTREKNELGFEVLSDAHNEVALAFGLVFELPAEVKPLYAKMGIDLPSQNGDGSYELPVTATYIIASDGTVAAAHVDPDYRYRLDPEDVIATLKKL